MAQDITALKQSFEQEYKEVLDTAKRGSREISQGELFLRYERLGISRKDMAQIIHRVDTEIQNKRIKIESYGGRINNCIRAFKEKGAGNLDQETSIETLEELVDITEEQTEELSEENSTAESKKSEIEIQLDSLRDKINEHDQNITNNVMEIGNMLIQAKACVKKIKKLKWQSWLDKNIKMPRSTASRYIKCTERFEHVAPAQHFDPSKMTVSKMFELLSISKENFEQFLKDAKEKDIKIQDMSKNELRDLIKGWKQDNIDSDKITKKKITVRLNLVEDDIGKFAELLQYVLSERKLSDDSLKSVATAINYLTKTDTAEVNESESGIVKE